MFHLETTEKEATVTMGGNADRPRSTVLMPLGLYHVMESQSLATSNICKECSVRTYEGKLT